MLTNITNGNKFIWQENYNRRFKFRNKQPYWAILKKTDKWGWGYENNTVFPQVIKKKTWKF